MSVNADNEGFLDPGVGILSGLFYQDFDIFDLKRIGLVSVLTTLGIDYVGLLVSDLRFVLDSAISEIRNGKDPKSVSWISLIDEFDYEKFSVEQYLFKRKISRMRATEFKRDGLKDDQESSGEDHFRSHPDAEVSEENSKGKPTFFKRFRTIKEKLMLFCLDEDLKFNGESNGEVRKFLFRIEHTMETYHLDFQEVKEIFIFLVGSKVKAWIENSIAGWSTFLECKQEMETAFLSLGWQEELVAKIQSTYQCKGESIVLYVARIQKLNNLLIDNLPTRRLIFVIYSNMLPFFRQNIFLEDCSSLEDLIRLGKKVETSAFASQNYYVHHPDYRSKERNKEVSRKGCKIVQSTSDIQKKDAFSQTYSNFCFGCGLFGQRKRTCWNCKKKGEVKVTTAALEN